MGARCLWIFELYHKGESAQCVFGDGLNRDYFSTLQKDLGDQLTATLIPGLIEAAIAMRSIFVLRDFMIASMFSTSSLVAIEVLPTRMCISGAFFSVLSVVEQASNFFF